MSGRTWQYVAAVAVAASVVGCGGSKNPASPSAVQTQTQNRSAQSVSVEAVRTNGVVQLAIGGSQQMTAKVLNSDGSQQDVTGTAVWSSTSASVAAVAAGMVTGKAAGECEILVTYGDVSTRVPVAILGGSGASQPTPSPAPGETSPSPAPTPDPQTPTSPGATVQALTLSGNANVTLGQTTQLTLIAKMSDGTTQTITTGAAWATSDAQVAALVGVGTVKAEGLGSATVSVQYRGVSASVTISVFSSGTGGGNTGGGDTGGNGGGNTGGGSTGGGNSGGGTTAPSVTSLTVTGTLSLTIGQATQLSARAALSDGTTVDVTSQVAWSASNALFASVSATGQVNGLAAGLSTVTAVYKGVTAQVQIQVSLSTPVVTLQTVTITGAASVKLLQSIELRAIAHFSDGSTRDVTDSCTWSVSNGLLGQVLGGVLRALGLGSINVTAGYQGQTVSRTLQITL